ncbi:zinc finger MYM-type 1-like [Pelobates cultripes]|uniref:Zinc finger MYM-type 1-like n=1 Tax=Pelobates cultripes TaxID=61616 RepID=A0AAD1S8D5_PELCU|nr:zinc finger MYM-type 1-like [Pelobates cultripes]
MSLTTGGYNDWKNLSQCLATHEVSPSHLTAMGNWTELLTRLGSGSTIDHSYQRLLATETQHWQNVLQRLVAIVQYLGKQCLAFRGSSDTLYSENNGNYLKLVEMMATFDSVMQSHLKKIQNSEIHQHYLGKDIQNELIGLISKEIRRRILRLLKDAKYYSIILDCTPDITLVEQMTMVFRFVSVKQGDSPTANPEIHIEERFLGFLPVHNSSGEGLTEAILNELEMLKIPLSDMRGQGFHVGEVYDTLIEIGGDMNFAALARIEASSLAKELNKFKLLCLIILWFNILSRINSVSKVLQSQSIYLPDVVELLESIKTIFQSYRTDDGFEDLLKEAGQLAVEMEIDPVFPPQVHQTRKKKKLKDVQKEELLQFCMELQNVLTNVKSKESDVDGRQLCEELAVLAPVIKATMTPVDILAYTVRNGFAPNVAIALRIMLTLPITVATGERSFSKLKIIKNYLLSSMSQERLVGLAMIAIENRTAEEIDFETLLKDFASAKARKVKFN